MYVGNIIDIQMIMYKSITPIIGHLMYRLQYMYINIFPYTTLPSSQQWEMFWHTPWQEEASSTHSHKHSLYTINLMS